MMDSIICVDTSGGSLPGAVLAAAVAGADLAAGAALGAAGAAAFAAPPSVMKTANSNTVPLMAGDLTATTRTSPLSCCATTRRSRVRPRTTPSRNIDELVYDLALNDEPRVHWAATAL